MKNKKVFLKLISIIMFGLFFFIKPIYAQEDKEELKKQVETLNLKVKELEKQLENKPTLPKDYFKYPFVSPGEEYWNGSQLRF